MGTPSVVNRWCLSKGALCGLGCSLVWDLTSISIVLHNSNSNPCHIYHFLHIYTPPLGLKIKSNLVFSRADEVPAIEMKNIYSNAKLMLKKDYLYSTGWHQRGTSLIIWVHVIAVYGFSSLLCLCDLYAVLLVLCLVVMKVLLLFWLSLQSYLWMQFHP